MQGYPRNYPPQQMRRGVGPMVQNPQARTSAQEYHDQQARAREQAEAIRNRSKTHPVDRDLPDGVEELVLGDGAQHYKSLREVEKRLDAAMMRKRMDTQEALRSIGKKNGTLRIWISNTVENQPWQVQGMGHDDFDFGSNVEATYRVKIEGRLLEADNEGSNGADDATNGDAGKEENAGAAPPSARPKTARSGGRKRLSHFFKSITIEYDRQPSLQPDQFARIHWERPNIPIASQAADLPKEADFDCLEFQRKSDESINVTINLVRDEMTPRFQLTQPLAELLDMEQADRKTVLMGIWEYVKAAGLQDEGDNRQVRCDARLHAALGVENFYFPQLAEIVMGSMFDAPPIKLAYTIRVDEDFHSGESKPSPTVYDIPVALDDPLQAQMEAINTSPGHMPALQIISSLDSKIAKDVQAMKEAKAKHSFLTSMSKDPANFTKRWISSQKRDLDVILGAGAWGEEDWQGAEWRRGGAEGPWGTKEAWQGVGVFLSRQDKTRPATAA